MRSAILFAGAAAAAEYGYGPAVVSSSSSAAGYTTITPGGSSYGPVTVTSQYQAVPTYDSKASSYSEYLYVSTVVTDADKKKCTVTKTEQPVTVYHSKSTLTHTTTYAAPSAAYPYNKNGTASLPHTKTWEELCETIKEVPYKQLGPSALPGYPGSGLCGKECYGKEDTKYQPVHVKEYKNGKWAYYTQTYTYAPPTPKASTYEHPGTYTVPEYDVTISKTYTAPAEATYTAPPGKTVTYGGSSTYYPKPTTAVCHYGAYETEGTTTKTIIKTTTIYADKPGTYTIAKPTVTKYESEHKCTYPTAKVYPPGVYHHSKETVTITKSHEAYTCSYHSTSTYPHTTPSKSASKDSYPTASSSTSEETYPTADPSADYPEPTESYGTPTAAAYIKRGGMLARRHAEEKKAAPAGKRVILV